MTVGRQSKQSEVCMTLLRGEESCSCFDIHLLSDLLVDSWFI